MHKSIMEFWLPNQPEWLEQIHQIWMNKTEETLKKSKKNSNFGSEFEKDFWLIMSLVRLPSNRVKI